MASYLVLVLDDLTVDLVCQKIYGRIEIFIGSFTMNVLTAQTHGDFGSMPQGLYREHDLGIDDVIEMPQHSRQFVHDIFPDGRGDVEVTTADAQVHSVLSF
ncbi:hypothetical protein A6B37_21280 [Achromobacter sp. HZ01]|nr:hypothetical protein A6B37_21280 [Achromobacter sp. HZ01]